MNEGLMKAMRCIVEGVCETKDDCRAYGCPYADENFDCMEDIIRSAYKILKTDFKPMEHKDIGDAPEFVEVTKLPEWHRTVKVEAVPVWLGRCVISKGERVFIDSENYAAGTKPYVEGQDEQGHYHKINMEDIEELLEPIKGIVRHKKEIERK